MRIDDSRSDALMWGIIQGFEEVTDRLLDHVVNLPDITCPFHITINGVPVCIADHALAGNGHGQIKCEHSSLRETIHTRSDIKAAFPAAVVAVKAGRCPNGCSANKAA